MIIHISLDKINISLCQTLLLYAIFSSTCTSRGEMHYNSDTDTPDTDTPSISGTRFIPVSMSVVLWLADVIYPLNDFGRLDLLLRGELRLALIIGEAREGRGQSGGRGGQRSGG